jgi:hypothetical protein
MYEINGICYADNPTPIPEVVAIRVLDDYRLWIRFKTGEEKIYDLKPELKSPCFKPLTNKSLFADVWIDCGTVAWGDIEKDNIDIAPENLFEYGVPAPENSLAPADREKPIMTRERDHSEFFKESEFIDRMSEEEFDAFLAEVVARNKVKQLATV